MTKNNRPMIRIHNVETNEIIDREMNDLEFSQFQLDQEASIAKETEINNKLDAKTALLERLGITEEEALLLLS